MKLQDIKYDALSAEKANNAWPAVFKQQLKSPAAILFAAIIIIILEVSVAERDPFALLPFGFTLFIIVLIYLRRKVSAYRDKIWADFATANGWQSTEGSSATIAQIPPAIFDIGSNQKLGTVVHADIAGHKCDVYMYHFTTGSGRSQQEHNYTIARVELSKAFPHMILDSKQSAAIYGYNISFRANIPQEKIKLEGNFNKYFSLYCEKGENIDALSIITPDVMQTLINSNLAQDIEIAGPYIYFMTSHDERSANALSKLFESVEALSDELDHRATSLQYVAKPAAIDMTQTTNAYFNNVIKRRTRILTIIVWALLALFIVFVIFGSQASR